MNDSDKKAFAEIMVGTGEIYDKSVSKTLMQTYFEMLKGYDIDQVRNGFSKHSLDPKHGSFFPKPADIARHLESNLSADNKAELAWSQVMHNIRSEGAYGSLRIDDKQAIAAVRSLGSWKSLCGTLEKDMTWKKKEFMSVYKTYEKTPIEMLPSSLPGLVELQDYKRSTNAVLDKIKAGIPKKLEAGHKKQ